MFYGVEASCRNVIGHRRMEKSVQIAALWRQVVPPAFTHRGRRDCNFVDRKKACETNIQKPASKYTFQQSSKEPNIWEPSGKQHRGLAAEGEVLKISRSPKGSAWRGITSSLILPEPGLCRWPLPPNASKHVTKNRHR